MDTVLFVERTGEDVNMEDKDAVRQFDFNKCDPEVWDAMCEQLERFGPCRSPRWAVYASASVEHAKAVIRKQLFTVKEYEIFPVYDTKEQFTIDSTRRGSNWEETQIIAAARTTTTEKGTNPWTALMDTVHMIKRRHQSMESVAVVVLRGAIAEVPWTISFPSPKPHNGGAHYDVSMPGPSKERRAPRSRSRSPVTLSKHVAREGGYGTLSDKENCREYRSKNHVDDLVDVTVHGWSRVQLKTLESVVNCEARAESAEAFIVEDLRLCPPRQDVVAKMMSVHVITDVKDLLKMADNPTDVMK
ncbi:hypothetical protein PInf_002666 [Phytophthora infestans]|nr:hypothetical protein PInf_002666 [Phytophthora infestans]